MAGLHKSVSQNLSINSNLSLKAALQAGVHLLWCLTFTDCIPFVRVEAHWFHLHPVPQKKKKIQVNGKPTSVLYPDSVHSSNIYLWDTAVGLNVWSAVAVQASPGQEQYVDWCQKTLNGECNGAPLCNVWTNALVRRSQRTLYLQLREHSVWHMHTYFNIKVKVLVI